MCAPAASAATARSTSTGRSAARRSAQGHAAELVGAHLSCRADVAALDRRTRAASGVPTQFALRNPDREAAGASVGDRAPSVGRARTRSRARCRTSCAAAPASRLCAVSPMPGSRPLAAFTPSDAMHVLDRQTGWCREAAQHGARILATEERNARAARAAASRRRRSASALTSTSCAKRAACCSPRHWLMIPAWRRAGAAGASSATGSSRIPSPGGASRSCCKATLGLARPLIAIGAPVGAYYPEVARRLGAPLVHPDACRGLQRGGRRRRRRFPDRRDLGESADLQSLSSSRSGGQPGLSRSAAGARARAAHIAGARAGGGAPRRRGGSAR